MADSWLKSAAGGAEGQNMSSMVRVFRKMEPVELGGPVLVVVEDVVPEVEEVGVVDDVVFTVLGWLTKYIPTSATTMITITTTAVRARETARRGLANCKR